MPTRLLPLRGASYRNEPSQSATTTTDAAGHFGFLTLAPDTYTITVARSGYQPVSVPGQVFFADHRSIRAGERAQDAQDDRTRYLDRG